MKLFYLFGRKKWSVNFTGLPIYLGLDTANGNSNNPFVIGYFNNNLNGCSPYAFIKFPFFNKSKTKNFQEE
jgi:hypothetical protein